MITSNITSSTPSTVLMDRVKFCNFNLEAFTDPKLVLEKNLVKYKPGNENQKEIAGIKFTSIHISDKCYLFNSLDFIVKTNGSIDCCLDLTIGDPHFHNLIGMNVPQYWKRLEDISRYIVAEYGIKFNFRDVKLRYLELQSTIMLDKDFLCYQKELQLLASMLPKRLRLKGNRCYYSNPMINDVTEINGVSRTSGQNGIDIKFYNKSAQLREVKSHDSTKRDVIEPEDRVLRFEVTFKSSQRIRSSFGTDVFSALSDEKFTSYVTGIIRDTLEEYKSWKYHQQDKLASKIASERDINPRSWAMHLMLRIASDELTYHEIEVLDVDDLISSLVLLGLSTDQLYQAKKTLMETCCFFIPYYSSGSRKNLAELFDKLQRKF